MLRQRVFLCHIDDVCDILENSNKKKQQQLQHHERLDQRTIDFIHCENGIKYNWRLQSLKHRSFGIMLCVV